MPAPGVDAGLDTVPDGRLDPGLERDPGARDTRLRELVAGLGSVLVAFSGGADSALVLAAAVRVLGPQRVVAATGVSGSLAARELTGAREFADSLGVRHLTPRTDEMSRPGYRANAGDRCYFCKTELMSVLRPLAAELGLAVVVTGTNADDLVAGFRPGIRAAREAGARAPLAEAGLTKADVRELSARWGLPTWDKPAAACLSSRIAYGIEVTPWRLSRIERAEEAVRASLAAAGAPPTDLRVRDLGEAGARVELDPGALRRLEADGGVRDRVVAAVGSAGLAPVVLARFRSGSLNDALPGPA
ncbi:MAG: ATP-dependent sacrificial sulfur transferase LarE [Kineosporiaceae bacterium]